ncbi:hypothetical protein FA09DRAFT_107498 [Tilletiopsis washingtonensis]|jgi:hypothetical protein|uniref:Uncharacterized protein n=1 Tax=Tilletiopsis washingtonensis TaxID=58919 RepID=A0A316Z3K1_9BASI|nr:hypothetical protein FA09DRAFT_107498 [Tilletiopsis washingtonensis]PWN96131.1 hypothetical protein FA09DRAFT_107498 [Tilletiopsis washingtonensis]
MPLTLKGRISAAAARRPPPGHEPALAEAESVARRRGPCAPTLADADARLSQRLLSKGEQQPKQRSRPHAAAPHRSGQQHVASGGCQLLSAAVLEPCARVRCGTRRVPSGELMRYVAFEAPRAPAPTPSSVSLSAQQPQQAQKRASCAAKRKSPAVAVSRTSTKQARRGAAAASVEWTSERRASSRGGEKEASLRVLAFTARHLSAAHV